MTIRTNTEPEITVILPVYNESAVLEDVCETVCQFTTRHATIECIFVDDGSTDNSRAILQAHFQQYCTSNVKVVGYEKNRGKGHAIRRGFQEARGQSIVTLDGDLPYSLDLVACLVAKLVDADVVIGSRPLDNPRGFLRRILGSTFNRITRIAFQMEYSDTQAGIKAFRYEAAKVLYSMQRRNRFAWDVEILVLAHHLRMQVVEHQVMVEPQHATKDSSIHPLFDSMQMFVDVINIRVDLLRGKFQYQPPAQVDNAHIVKASES